jgi:cytochrome P450
MVQDTPPRSGETPPGPEGPPIVGNYLPFVREPFAFMTRNARTYGDIVSWEEIDGRFYQLNHPEHIEHVLVANNGNYIKGESFQRALSPITGQGTLNSEGAIWRRNRHLIQPAFGPDRIEEYATMMTDATERALEGWRDGQTREIHEDTMELTLDIVSRALFGVDIGDRVDEIGLALEEFMAASESLSNYVLPETVPTPSRRRIEAASRRLDDVVYDLIRQRRENPGDDVISMLFEARDDEETPVSIEGIRDEVVTLLLAGHETTALSLTFTVYLLSRYPAAEERLVAELEEVVDGRTPTMADLPSLPYTEKVVKESMRLYPPVPTVVREPVKPDIIGGYEVPPGSTIRMHQWVVHRDGRWYDDPLAFDPGRWTDEFERSLPSLAYFPFSAGPRRCIGDRFAMLEARLILATIYGRYHLELVPGTELDLMAAITARPRDPVRVTVHAR